MFRTTNAITCIILIICAVFIHTLPAGAYTGPHPKMQVRLQWVDDQGMRDLKSIPDLDIMKWTPGEELILVSNENQLARFEELGFEVEVVIPDMEEHYAAERAGQRNFGDFYSYSEMIVHLDQLTLEFPEIIGEKFSIGTTHEGNTIWAIKVSDNPGLDEPDEPEVLFDALHHAREPITVNVLIETIRHLGENYGTDPEITFVVDNRQTYFVPVVNPDGYLYNEQTYPQGGGMWRKNRRDNASSSCYGVDPNRNYPYLWDNGGISYDPCNDVYLGPSPGSEPCVQALMGLINDHEFVTHDSYHSVWGAILIPWGYSHDVHTPDDTLFREIAGDMAAFCGYQPGQAGETIGYDCSGTTTDWAYGEQITKPKIFTFCTEVDGSGFWPSDSEIPGLVAENIPKNILLMKIAGLYLSLTDLALSGGNGDARPDPGETLELVASLSNDAIGADAENVTITLSSLDAYVQMNNALAAVGTVPARGTGDNSSDPLSFNLDPDCPPGHNLVLSFEIACPGYTMNFMRDYIVGDLPILYSDDMESGIGDWTHAAGSGGYTDQWHQSSQRNHTTSGTTSWKFGATGAGEYTDLADGVLTTAPIEIGPLTQLHFWHWMDAEASGAHPGQAYDGGLIEMTVNGTPWTQILPDDGYTHTIRSSSQSGPFPAGTPVYSGTFDWTPAVITLDGVIGEAQFRFRFGSDGNTGGEGWYIDDVAIVGTSGGNTAPGAPELVSPFEGETVSTSVPTLVVTNAVDPDPEETLTYGFRVFSDPLLTNLVTSATGITEGAGTTSWTVNPSLADDTYYWLAFANDGQECGSTMPTASFTVVGAQSISDNEWASSLRFRGISPNPSHGVSTLNFDLGQGGMVEARIFDLQGRSVRELGQILPAGSQSIEWDGCDEMGRSVSGGIYLFSLKAREMDVRGRILLVR